MRVQVRIGEAVRAQVRIGEAVRAQVRIAEAVRAQVQIAEAVRAQVQIAEAVRVLLHLHLSGEDGKDGGEEVVVLPMPGASACMEQNCNKKSHSHRP